MAYAQRSSEFVKCDNRRIASPTLQAAKVLLAESRTYLHLFLCQALFLTQAREIPAYQLPHIHARLVGVYAL